jgi:hypothetical protein
LRSLSLVRARGIEKSKPRLAQEDLAELPNAARQNLPACVSETGQRRIRGLAGLRSFPPAPRYLSARARGTLPGGNRMRPAAMRTRFLRLRRRNDKILGLRQKCSCHSDAAGGGIWSGTAFKKRRHFASEHGHPPANLPNRFGGQQKSEELNIMKGSAFIVGESRRVSDADRRT